MSHKYSLKRSVQSSSSKYGDYSKNFSKNFDFFKTEFSKGFGDYSKIIKKNVKIPKANSSSGKTFKTTVVAGLLLLILSLTIGFPVTLCLGVLVLFLLLYK